jgi:hypothetical protein
LITGLSVNSGDLNYQNFENLVWKFENLLEIGGMNLKLLLPLVSLKKTVSQKYFVTSAADLGSFETLVPKMKSR